MKSISERVVQRVVGSIPTTTHTGSLPERVAARLIQAAAFLNVGDIVLVGKYKNSRQKIIGWSKDRWGNPTVLLENLKSGKKSEKSLFTVWRADIKEKALAEQAKAEKSK